jgi:hypothetical protein
MIRMHIWDIEEREGDFSCERESNGHMSRRDIEKLIETVRILRTEV